MASELFNITSTRARARDLSVVDLIAAVEALKVGENTADVLELYRLWLRYNPDHPVRYAVYFNYGTALNDAGDVAAAREAFLQAIAANKEFWPAYINLGTALERLGAADQAIAQWMTAANGLAAIEGLNVSYKTAALKQVGRVLETANRDEEAEATLKRVIDIDPRQRDATQHYVSLRQRQCKWPAMMPAASQRQEDLARDISPLSLATLCDDPILHMASGYHYNLKDVGPAPGLFTAGAWAPPEKHEPRRLRIGYVSSDMREHAVGFLTAEIFGLHDRSKVEVFIYYCGIPQNDTTKERIKTAADHWCDISLMADKVAAKRITEDGIDILVDLNGYTKDARTKLFALRPAPIIVNWLGFPGSMGSPYHNYIIADPFIIPPEHEVYYTETVMRLPCYQPTDRKRPIPEKSWTRAALGLPEDAIVYCCFNGMQKITKPVFARWMQILGEVPGSVLWLLAGAEDTHNRLREMARAASIDPTRLIFADRLPNAEHLARYPLADLFLDTFPYGAHTTASDALWKSLPVLTLPGLGFASRVCGSLVKSAGLPDLVCSTPQDYVDRAIALGRDKALLQSYRERLKTERERCVLFDTPGLVRSLEGLFAQMWEDYCTGALPEPDLTNLDIYMDIGAERDLESGAVLTGTALHAAYDAALTYRHSLRPIKPDNRLCARPQPGRKALRQAAE